MIRQRAHVALAASLLAVAVLATACAGSGSDAASPATTNPTTTAGPATTTDPSTTAPSSTTTVPGVDPSRLVVQPAVATTTRATDAALTTPDGRTRTYHVYVPTGLDAAPGSAPVPLLVALHGGGGWGQQFEKNSGYDGLAQANGFIVVYPDGVGVGPEGSDVRTWNGGACCGPAAKQDVDDVAFIRLLLDQLEQEHAIDPDRVFAAGHSNGGIMSFRLACELSDRIVAIGVQSSALEVDDCRPSQPVSVLQIHGSADQNVPIAGGRGSEGASGVTFQPPFDGATTLAAADGCPASPDVRQHPENADLTVTQWAPCTGGSTVAFLEVAGASHAYMGHDAGGSGRSGPVYEDLDSSLQIWNFLAQHTRR